MASVALGGGPGYSTKARATFRLRKAGYTISKHFLHKTSLPILPVKPHKFCPLWLQSANARVHSTGKACGDLPVRQPSASNSTSHVLYLIHGPFISLLGLPAQTRFRPNKPAFNCPLRIFVPRVALMFPRSVSY